MYIAIGLIALALGYQVFAEASKEKEGLKLLGQIVGVAVMVLALLATICSATKCLYDKSGCPMDSKSQCATMMKKNCPTMTPANCPMKGDEAVSSQ